jgi:glyoxylase-like metal-dependent hydrolase (beta-lactamase superfamily II)
MEITKLADGVYGAIYSEMRFDPVQSNSLIVIGDTAVCVVDAHYTPSAARATIAAIRRLTKLPVRYVVTTHWHDDHIFGNQEYQAAFPGVQIVAQRHARESMIAGASRHQQELEAHYSKSVPRIEASLATGKTESGAPLAAADRAEAEMVLPIYRDFLADVRTVRVVLPTITFDKEVDLYLGRRMVRVISFGPGNTKGDVVVLLPEEKIAAVGDLVVYPIPFIYGGYPSSWVKVIDSVKALAPATIVPGHGPVMRDFTYVNEVSNLLQSLATQVSAAVARGLTLDETRKAVDLTKFHDSLVKGDASREGTFQASILNSGIEAAYEEAKANCRC